MKIGLDLRCLPTDGSEGSGVAHAARALCSSLILDTNVEWVAFLPKGSNFLPLNKGELERVSFKQLLKLSSHALRAAMRHHHCDLLFVPSGAVPLGLYCPAVPWIHDLAIFDHPEWFPESWMRRQFTTRLVLRGIKRAPVVFAVSQYTKNVIIRQTGMDGKRIMVTGEGGDDLLAGISKDQLPTAKRQALKYCKHKWGIMSAYVLALGTVEPRKNLAMLIKAWSKISFDNGGRMIGLVIAGRWGWKCNDVKNEIATLPPKIKKYFYRIEKITDEDKRNLLLAAVAVAVPSLDEGFGLVALEALQAGSQVIVSNRGALPEVVGDAGLKLDPTDEVVWTQALRKAGAIERPKVFNSVSLAAVVDVLKGGPDIIQRSASVFTAASQTAVYKKRASVLSVFNWNNTSRIVLDGLTRLV